MKEFIHLALTLFFFERIFFGIVSPVIEKKEKTNKIYLLSGAVPESCDVENICLKMAATLSRVIKGTLYATGR